MALTDARTAGSEDSSMYTVNLLLKVLAHRDKFDINVEATEGEHSDFGFVIAVVVVGVAIFNDSIFIVIVITVSYQVQLKIKL